MSTSLGRWGEDIAEAYLWRRGWVVENRNFRVGRGEIDLVASREGLTAFVEVKTRRSGGCGRPAEAITARKRSEINRVAHGWVQQFGSPESVYRFDAISIIPAPGGSPEIEHTENAWLAEPLARGDGNFRMRF